MQIRPYKPHDALALSRIHGRLFPDRPLSPAQFHQETLAILAAAGLARAAVLDDGALAGYATLAPVPGLPGMLELQGGIDPPHQRRGLGTLLWQEIRSGLIGSAVRQVSHCVSSLDSAAARFLQANGFSEEHEEWILVQGSLLDLPSTQVPGDVIRTLPRRQAIPLFRRLYDATFRPHGWYQPYSRAEVAAALKSAADLRFLFRESRACGFAWLHLRDEEEAGEIEPLGILPDYQRQGLGRFLLLDAMQELAHRGAVSTRVGVWSSNHAAVRLYERLGFVHQQTLTFLAFDLA